MLFFSKEMSDLARYSSEAYVQAAVSNYYLIKLILALKGSYVKYPWSFFTYY